MIPVSITMQAFGPYESKKVIDFNGLNKKGLFLITGKTGSGKTTILDAICVALYCKSTGGLRTFKELRNVSCEEKTDTIVEFVFDLKDNTYKFQRSLHMHKIKGKEKKELRDEHNCWKKQDDQWVLLSSGAESRVRNKAQEIIGLDCEQFSKVIVLPQGEFKNLLVASSIEKAKIFTTLFKTDKYQRIINGFQKASDELKLKMNNNLMIKENLLNAHAVNSLEELKAKISDTENLLNENRNIQKELSTKIKSLREKLEFEKMYETLKIDTELKYNEKNKIKNDLELAKQKYNEKKEFKSKIEQLKLEEQNYFKLANDLNSNLNKIQKYESLNVEKIKYENLLKEILPQVQAIKKKINEIKTKIKEKKETQKELEQIAENLQDTYINFQKIKKEKEQFDLLKSLNLKLKTAAEEYDLILENYNSQKLKLDILKQKKSEVEEILFSNECVKIAEKLIENEPCPVCGSRQHPCVANKKTTNEEDSLNILKNINNLIKAEEETFNKIRQDKENKMAIVNLYQENYEKQKGVCEDSSIREEENNKYLKRLEEQLKKEKKADEDFKELKIQINEYEISLQNEDIVLNDYIKKQEDTQKNIEIISAKQKYLLTEKTLFTKKEIKEKIQQNTENIKKCVSLQKELSDSLQKAKMDLEVNIERFKNAQIAYKESNKKLESLLNKKEEYDAYLNGESEQNLNKYVEENDFVIETIGKLSQVKVSCLESEKQISKIDTDLEDSKFKYSKIEKLSQLLSGSNPQKMPIKIFVLGMMLDEVLCRANVYFAQFSNNRYSLSRASKLAAKGYSGLDIDVFDSYYGTIRPVKTLSGGELFLASLSLAFGLSDVIQSFSGGIRLDSIFIDEGFGSLDLQSLDTAINAFSSVIKNGRIIGIISHVDELKNKIEAKIQVD